MAFSSRGLVHRPTVTGRRGLVSSANPTASLAGVRILIDGGNAIDAAVATAAALNVAEPYMSGIGGEGYMHVYHASSGEHKVLDYVGLAPKAAQLDLFDSDNKNRGPLSVLTPGACGGWLEALRCYGTMDAAAVFAPAIDLAENGIAITVKNAFFFDESADEFRKYPSSSSTYLSNGRAPRPGDVLIQEDLAETFRAVAESGPEIFYTGEIADIIAAFMAETGGLITKEDLTGFEPVWLDPISVDYRGFQIWVPPRPCQGFQFLQTLNMMEGFDVAELGHNTTETLHYFIEAAKLSIADRIAYAKADGPDLTGLLSKGYAAERRALIGDRARPVGGETYTEDKLEQEVSAGDPRAWTKTECTTHFDVVDADGNAVAVTQSLGSAFGSAMVVPGTGIALNNFMNWFDLEPGSPNAICPSKKIEMCMSPVLAWDEDGLRFLIGTPGSYGILQTTPQMIMNIIDHRVNIQAAIEAPRVRATSGYVVNAERRIDGDVLAELETKGHQISPIEEWSMGVGGGQGIAIDPESGAFMGGADPRRDGYALGW